MNSQVHNKLPWKTEQMHKNRNSWEIWKRFLICILKIFMRKRKKCAKVLGKKKWDFFLMANTGSSNEKYSH